MEKTFDVCNKCHVHNNSALVHCAVCSYPFHVKCVAPKLTVKACDDLISNPCFNFYCEEHQNLCVHKLLNRISSLERKFRMCVEPLTDISNELDKHQDQLVKSGYNKSSNEEVTNVEVNTVPTPVQCETLNVSPMQQQSESNISACSNITFRRSNKRRQNTNSSQQESPKRQENIRLLSEAVATTSQNFTSLSPVQDVPTLRCVQPKRAIFLSGLEPDTSTEDVLSYIGHKTKTRLNINIRKMKFNTQSRSAVFVIYVGTDENIFNLLCDPSFWPDRLNCREYDFFRQRPEQRQRKRHQA